MQKKSIIYLIFFLLFFRSWIYTSAQNSDSAWTLPACIDFAMQKNLSIRSKQLNNRTNVISLEQVKAERFPSINASVSQNFEWSKSLGSDNSYSSYSGSNGTNVGINSSLLIYNGFRTKNNIKQARLSYEAGNAEIEFLKETVSLNVLSAYLQVLYAEEQVKNGQRQIESTNEQLNLSEERFKLGAISKSEYLQVKSELASENYTLANSQNQMSINFLLLMQLMELPVNDSFKIEYPAVEIPLNISAEVNVDSIYNLSLGIKPQIKSTEINREIAEVGISIAKAGYQPTLTLSAGLNTGYNSILDVNYNSQMANRIVPSVGLTLNIPIYQNRKLRSNVSYAKIETDIAIINEQSTKNELRKSVEQVCVDYKASVIKYQASLEKYNSMQESYNVAQEKFNQGLLSSVEFLIQKNNLISAESELLQAKFNLLFSKKIIDFYTGIPLTL
jgi:outer membrane protein